MSESTAANINSGVRPLIARSAREYDDHWMSSHYGDSLMAAQFLPEEVGVAPDALHVGRIPYDSTPTDRPWESVANPAWMASARCLADGAPNFTPNIGGVQRVRMLKAFCGSCEVRQDCLDWALSWGAADLVYGGTTPGERRDLRPSRGRRSGLLYVAKRESDGLIKIGWSTDLRTRLRSLSAEHGRLELLRTEEGDMPLEQWIHRRLARRVIEGREWYRDEPEVWAVLGQAFEEHEAAA